MAGDSGDQAAGVTGRLRWKDAVDAVHLPDGTAGAPVRELLTWAADHLADDAGAGLLYAARLLRAARKQAGAAGKTSRRRTLPEGERPSQAAALQAVETALIIVDMLGPTTAAMNQVRRAEAHLRDLWWQEQARRLAGVGSGRPDARLEVCRPEWVSGDEEDDGDDGITWTLSCASCGQLTVGAYDRCASAWKEHKEVRDRAAEPPAPWTPKFSEGEEPTAEGAIVQALGAASMCWKPEPAGEFDADMAEWVFAGLTGILDARLVEGVGVGAAAESVMNPPPYNPMAPGHDIRTFTVQRREDVSGTSGTGAVAMGAVFPDGTTVVQWQTRVRSVVVYNSMADALTIHGHGDSTGFVFDVDPGRIVFSNGSSAEVDGDV